GGEPTVVPLERRVEFPTQAKSRELVNGLWRLGVKNPGMAGLLSAVYGLLFLFFHGAFVGWCGQHPGLGACPDPGPVASPYLQPLIGMLAGNGVLLALVVFGALFAVANLFPAAPKGV